MKNKVALITGGLGDIGAAICHEFYNLGAKVIAADRVVKDKALLWQTQQKKLGLDIGFTCTEEIIMFLNIDNNALI